MPRRFAPRNDMLKLAACLRGQGRNDSPKPAPVYACKYVLPGQARSRLQIRLGARLCTRAHTCPPSACHCEERGGRPATWQSASPQGNLPTGLLFRQIRSTFRIRRKKLFLVLWFRKENGLPRRFAPRNDMLKLAACLRLPMGTAGIPPELALAPPLAPLPSARHRAPCPCTRRSAPVFCMSLRGAGRPPRDVAIRIPPGKLAKLALLQANPWLFSVFAGKNYFLFCGSARRTDCRVASLLAMTC